MNKKESRETITRRDFLRIAGYFSVMVLTYNSSLGRAELYTTNYEQLVLPGKRVQTSYSFEEGDNVFHVKASCIMEGKPVGAHEAGSFTVPNIHERDMIVSGGSDFFDKYEDVHFVSDGPRQNTPQLVAIVGTQGDKATLLWKSEKYPDFDPDRLASIRVNVFNSENYKSADDYAVTGGCEDIMLYPNH